MSILIKGIEMPKTCADCRLTTWNGEDTVCPFSRVSALNIGRQVDCPLIEVPEHGDLIDRDELLSDKSEVIHKFMVFGGHYVIEEDKIKDAPIIIPSDKESEA